MAQRKQLGAVGVPQVATAPGAPTSGRLLYTKTGSSSLYTKDSAGAETRVLNETEADARYAPTSHFHDASALSSGVLADGRMPTRLAPYASATTTTGYNSMATAGWFVMDATAANAPVAVTCYLDVRVGVWGSNYVEQIARRVDTGDEYRRAMTSGSWGPWVLRTNHGFSDVPWASLPFVNSWNHYDASSAYGTARYCRRGGVVHITGLVAQPVNGQGHFTIAILPPGFRPGKNILVGTFEYQSLTYKTTRLDVSYDGFIVPTDNSNASVSFMSVQLSYLAEQ